MRQGTTTPMHLTLFVPDILWPDRDDRQAFEFEQAVVLARYLSLAEHTSTTLDRTDSWESVLAQAFGLTDSALALGGLRLLGESANTQQAQAYNHTLLCADPVNLDFIQQSLVLSEPGGAQLSPEDSALLIASLNEEFANEGNFFAGNANNHWYFAPSNPDSDLPSLSACSRLLGRRINADDSRQVLGSDGLRWLNRIQMCLNGHPVNEERQMKGLNPINSVWPWGVGTLMPRTHDGNTAPFQLAVGDNALLRGLCAHTCTAYSSQMTPAASSLLLDTRLSTAIAQNDLDAWQKAVQQLTVTYIAPALDALTNGVLHRLTVISPDAHQTHQWTLDASHRGLTPSFIQRVLGRTQQHPDLATLVNRW